MSFRGSCSGERSHLRRVGATRVAPRRPDLSVLDAKREAALNKTMELTLDAFRRGGAVDALLQPWLRLKAELVAAIKDGSTTKEGQKERYMELARRRAAGGGRQGTVTTIQTGLNTTSQEPFLVTGAFEVKPCPGTVVAPGTCYPSNLLANMYRLCTKRGEDTRPLYTWRYGIQLSAINDLEGLQRVIRSLVKVAASTTRRPTRAFLLSLLTDCWDQDRSRTDTALGRRSCAPGVLLRRVKGVTTLFQEHEVVAAERAATATAGDVQFLNLSFNATTLASWVGFSQLGKDVLDFKQADAWAQAEGLLSLWQAMKATTYKRRSSSPVRVGDAWQRLLQMISIFLLRYALQQTSTTHDYQLFVHCKSGKDRTGLAVALEQTVVYFAMRATEGSSPLAQLERYVTLAQNTTKPETANETRFRQDFHLVLRFFLLRGLLYTFWSTGRVGYKFGSGLTQNPFAQTLLGRGGVSQWNGAGWL